MQIYCKLFFSLSLQTPMMKRFSCMYVKVMDSQKTFEVMLKHTS